MNALMTLLPHQRLNGIYLQTSTPLILISITEGQPKTIKLDKKLNLKEKSLHNFVK